MSDDEYAGGGGGMGDDYEYGGAPGYDDILTPCRLYDLIIH